MSRLLEEKIESFDKRISRLEKLISKSLREGDWIYDPDIVAGLKKISRQSKENLKNLSSAEEIFRELGY